MGHQFVDLNRENYVIITRASLSIRNNRIIFLTSSIKIVLLKIPASFIKPIPNEDEFEEPSNTSKSTPHHLHIQEIVIIIQSVKQLRN